MGQIHHIKLSKGHKKKELRKPKKKKKLSLTYAHYGNWEKRLEEKASKEKETEGKSSRLPQALSNQK